MLDTPNSLHYKMHPKSAEQNIINELKLFSNDSHKKIIIKSAYYAYKIQHAYLGIIMVFYYNQDLRKIPKLRQKIGLMREFR